MSATTLGAFIAMAVGYAYGMWIVVARIDRRLDRIDDRIGALEDRVTTMDQRLTGKMTETDQRLTGKIAEMDQRLTGKIDALAAEVARIGERLDAHLTNHPGPTQRLASSR